MIRGYGSRRHGHLIVGMRKKPHEKSESCGKVRKWQFAIFEGEMMICLDKTDSPY